MAVYRRDLEQVVDVLDAKPLIKVAQRGQLLGKNRAYHS